jgi:hypothetical protein
MQVLRENFAFYQDRDEDRWPRDNGSGSGKMKHHIILMLEATQLKNSYLIWEYNIASEYNDVPEKNIADALQAVPIAGVRDYLKGAGWVQRSWEDLGQASLTEILLVGTGCISVMFFKPDGMPDRQVVYDLRVKKNDYKEEL